jgi:hypothetical protein
METDREEAADQEAPHCARHGVRGRPGEEWFGWECPMCVREMHPRGWRKFAERMRSARSALGAVAWMVAIVLGPVVYGLIIAGLIVLVVWGVGKMMSN